jgi:hypothetical protein
MKRRCYERGAEDNLTAVIVQVGQPKHDVLAIDDERTVDARVESIPTAPLPSGSEVRLTPPSRIAFPGPTAQAKAATASPNTAKNASSGRRGVLRFFVFLLFLAVAGGAFYGGMRYQQFRSAGNAAVPTQPGPLEDRAAFEHRRALLDADPQKWLAGNVTPGSKPLDSKDPEFLYFYGRAQMLQGNHAEAREAFRLALTNLQSDTRARLPLEAEIKLADAADALKSKPSTPSQAASMAEKNAVTTLDELLGLKSEPTPK